MVDARTRVCALFGHPVGHSLSPVMQNTAFRVAGINAVYVALDVSPGALRDALQGMRAMGFLGANVTIPHKEAAMGLVDRLDGEAVAAGAINTVVLRDGVLVGYNTDGEGFLRSLGEAGVDPAGMQALIIGAGGAAKAVALALARAGVRSMVITNRTAGRAEELAGLVRLHGVRAAVLPWKDVEDAGAAARRAFGAAELIIQTTSLGMAPKAEAVPPVPAAWFSRGQVVCDLVYNPVYTVFLEKARSAGARAVPGLGMLLHQGAASFELWTGVSAPLEAMRSALEAEIEKRGLAGNA
ncbi:shikimate dehydrogenase [Desulforudis sp. 1088]|uniref:shikimate dehydrogenase n=2 Tax=Candidatus Desulforudis TaxID=471826 RepID=UPI003CE5366C